MAKSFTPGAHVIIVSKSYSEFLTAQDAETAFEALTGWGVLMRITAEGKPVATKTKGLDTATALGIMQTYR
jgi:hypothetical protein